jgi:hypothetical protein
MAKDSRAPLDGARNVVAFTSLASVFSGADEVEGRDGLRLSIRPGYSDEGCRNVAPDAERRAGYVLTIERDGNRAREFWTSRAQAWARAEGLVPRRLNATFRDSAALPETFTTRKGGRTLAALG